MAPAKSILFFLILPCLVTVYSCDMPDCRNTNPVFEQYSPERNEYKRELAQQMRRLGPDNLSYWFEQYREKDGKRYITAFVHGDSLCAKAEMVVRNDAKLEHLIGVQGKSYSGAELRGLKIGIEEDSTNVVFVYKGLDRILD